MVVGVAAVRPGFRMKGAQAMAHLQPALTEQSLQHRVGQQTQFSRTHLQGHVAVAQVVGRPKQIQGFARTHQQQRLRRGLHPSHGQAVLRGQPFTGAQGLAPGQLKQHRAAVPAMAQSPQPGALIGGELEDHGIPRNRIRRKQPQPMAELWGGRERVGHSNAGFTSGSSVCLARAEHAPRHTALSRAPRVPGPPPSAFDAPPSGTRERVPWHGRANLRFSRRAGVTTHQGETCAPFKLLRASHHPDGRCELPLLHTAGGLVGGDLLTLQIRMEAGSQALITSVAAQKVYGSIGRSRCAPLGDWTRQTLQVRLEQEADLEWLPQEVVLYANGLHEQHTRVVLAPGASWLGAELVRLGRTAAGESLEAGRWRSRLEICRGADGGATTRWELVDRLELAGAALREAHGMAGEPVFGSLAWVGPEGSDAATLRELVDHCRRARDGLDGEMACGALDCGLVARYRGPSTTAARWWFTRIWQAVRKARHLPPPTLPRVWPFQEDPLGWNPGSLASTPASSALNPPAPRGLRQ
jgi:urease accessory protein